MAMAGSAVCAVVVVAARMVGKTDPVAAVVFRPRVAGLAYPVMRPVAVGEGVRPGVAREFNADRREVRR